MKSALLEGPRRRIPVRNCGLCGKTEDVLHLARVGRLRICSDCFRAQVSAATKGRDDEADDALILLRKIDTIFRYGHVALRLAFYVVLYQLAKDTSFGAHILTGFLLGDGITWLASAWFDRRFHSLAVGIEIILYTGAIALWLHLTGGLLLPEHPADKAIVALSFMGTFGAKGSWRVWKLLGPGDG